ncbi:MAG: squalene/phytoene synthase family protein [Anaerolineae bacterium]|nr:squalene/phytoene synthase family protein [Anaerolineae bacterium]
MSLQIGQPTAWEALLIDWAERALQNSAPSHHLVADSTALDQAFAVCKAITAENSKTFFIASALLPPEKRRAVRALYAFCRVTDDLVDRAEGGSDPADVRLSLEEWRTRALQPHPPVDQPVALAWAETRARFGVPVGYAEQLIDGVAADLTKKRYQTFEELAAYSYGVASTVGLMAMHIVGFNKADRSRALPYAVRLGVALQLTNILRDVADDWRGGRLYLPLAELEAHGLSEADIAAGRVDDRWRAFMREQIARTRRLYDEAMPGIAMLHPEGRFAIAAAAELYRAILDDIEAHDYDVFSRRAHLSAWGKMRRLPGIWWRSRGAVMVHL